MADDTRLWAWIGEDELGSGIVGIKRVMIGNEYFVCATHNLDTLQDPRLVAALQQQSRTYGKTIQLVELSVSDTLRTLEPGKPPFPGAKPS